MSMSCFDCHDYVDGYNRGKREGAIEALKYIRDKIQDMADNVPYTSQLSIDAHKRDIDIVRERINELKGVKNEKIS